MYLNLKMLVSTIFLITFLTGCWKQSDVVTIKSDGSTEFETDIVITEKGFTTKDVEELTSEFVKGLKSAGWQVEKKWVSKSVPFKLSFSGRGNIRQVKSASDFYKIQKINEDTYSIRFVPAEAKGGKSSRSMQFKRGFFGGAKIIDERGNEVKAIDNVLGNQTYKIVF
ncbi:hypothetical protein H8K52_20315 [Undibacterium seohonense]|uniref:Lipoprotein n=1 Tax=Undibacterium seohonense TaxID=1344950 RepID=A0ABR6XBN2_9BURK|nr:hypothetical protein [Undibacterium seohonense]MBC3809684.1 hypothetical protein [Undibacterium seohonense]